MKTKKRIIVISLLIAMIVCLTFLLSSCDDSTAIGRTVNNIIGKSDIVYQASTRFLYSLDGGNSWTETIQEIPVNQTYYLAIEMQVSQSEKTSEEKSVVAKITIPSTEILDCYLDDHPGVSITGKPDAITGSISYDFNIVTSTTPQKFRVIFDCRPLSEGKAKFEVVYDDNVSSNWDATGSIKYVSTQEKEATE